MTEEYFETGMKKGRGRAQRSLDLIQAMYKIAEEGQPITGRGVGYKLFSRNLIPSMGRNDMQTVYRLLKEAREEGTIPWAWIVDETRALEKVATWDDPADFVDTVSRSYRRDFWQQQPERVQVWSEKGTIRGVLQPALDEYAVGFMPTILNDVSQDDDSHPLTILYLGDYDPSGLWMSEQDIPERIARYGGNHISIDRATSQRLRCAGPEARLQHQGQEARHARSVVSQELWAAVLGTGCDGKPALT